MKNILRYILLLTVILLSAVLRFYNLDFNQPFGWDQENLILYPAKDILISHKFTLIGPRTSIGGMFIGPLYYYISAFFMFIFGLHPQGSLIMAGILSLFTLIIAFLLLKKYLGFLIAFFYVCFWSLSPFILKIG